MPSLRVDLQEGFQDDVVTVRLDGGAERRKEAVTTNEMVGYAGSFEFEVEPGRVRLDLSVQTRVLSKTIDLDVTGDLYVGVTVSAKDIAFRASSEPMGYL
jgi:hypothetical protein